MHALLAVLLAILSLLLPAPAGSTAALEPSNWAGAIELPGGIKLDFSVALTDDAGTISIPMQGAKDIALTDVSTADHMLKFVIVPPGAPEAAKARFELKISEDGKSAEGLLHQSGGQFPVKATRLAEGEKPKGMSRPQEPKPPFAYEITSVKIENKQAGVTLGGTLSWPSSGGPHPAVVMITGSGPQDRDEALLGHRPFFVITDYLVRHGIAVLRYDDRGVGESTGTFATSTSDDFATDALSAVEFLKTLPQIDPKRIGLVGHSEGGLIAPICASQSKDVAFIVLLAGTGVPGADILRLQSKLINMSMGKPEADAERESARNAEVLKMVVDGKSDDEIAARIRQIAIDEMNATPEGKAMPEADRNKKASELATQQLSQISSPWFKRFLALDPRDYLSKTTCPVLALNGTKDLQVPYQQNLPEIEKALKSAGNTDVTIQELDGLNHLFQHTQTGAPSEYAQIEETFAPEALEAMSNWIRAKTGVK